MDFDPPVQISRATGEHITSFAHSADLLAWLDLQERAWNNIPKPNQRYIAQFRAQQEQAFAAIRSAVEAEDKGRIEKALTSLRDGTSVSTEHRLFPVIASVAAVDPDSAGYILVMARSDAPSLLNNMGVGNHLVQLLRALSNALPQSAETTKHVQAALDSSFIQTKGSYEAALNAARKSNKELEEYLSGARRTFDENQSVRGRQWDEHMERSQGEWSTLKLTYDTELGLRAPTTYWSERAVSQRNIAIAYGAAFCVTLIAGISAFAAFGVGYLVALPNDKNAVLGLLPILVPAFAAVWILRILGRLLAESVNLMRDARERETLVKTFLALMKDDSTGKAVVKDEDRILILHSLFRPASTGAIDDSPPVHWFDVLASRMGTKK